MRHLPHKIMRYTASTLDVGAEKLRVVHHLYAVATASSEVISDSSRLDENEFASQKV